MRLAYLNGEFVDLAAAKISPLDRGFLFGDGVYEVVPVYNGKFFRFDEHLARLQHSLTAIKINSTYSTAQWRKILTRIVAENDAGNQAVYIQITRGAPSVRQHTFPSEDTTPTYFATSWPFELIPIAKRKGGSAMTLPDDRWQLCHIKSINLLPNVLAAQHAAKNGHKEALLIREGYLVEATSSNVFIVKNNVLQTPPKTENMLGGITRDVILELAAKHNIKAEIKPISRLELQKADEIWISSSTKEAWPIIELDHKPVGNGKIGPLWKKMIQHYEDFITETAT